MNDKIKMVLRLFRNKIPCKSKYLPKALDISNIKDRKTEIMVRYCKVLLNKLCKFNCILNIKHYTKYSYLHNFLVDKVSRKYNIRSTR